MKRMWSTVAPTLCTLGLPMTSGSEELVRIATAPLGAEVTGIMVNDDGELFLDAELCGGVYRAPVLADLDINRLEPAIVGKSLDEGCDAGALANPDNILAYSGGLLIAEDAGPKMHPVDMLWLLKN